MTSENQAGEMKNLSPDLYTILRDVLYNVWLVVLAFALGVMGTYAVLRQFYTPTYTSSVTLIIRSRSGTTSNYNNLSASMELTDLTDDKTSPIDSLGRGSHKVWVKRKE